MMNEQQKQEVQELVQNAIMEAITPFDKRIKSIEQGGGLTPFHRHNGIDAPQIIIKDLSRIFVKNATWDPPSLSDGQGSTTTVSVPGVGLGDFALASFDKDLQSMMLTSYVSANGVVSVRLQNETGGVLDLASGTLRVMVLRKQS